jgi:hypothetical protein
MGLPLCTPSAAGVGESPPHSLLSLSAAAGAFSATTSSTHHSGGTPLPSPCPTGAPSPSSARVVDYLPPEHRRRSGTLSPAVATTSSSTTGHPGEHLHPYGCPAGSSFLGGVLPWTPSPDVPPASHPGRTTASVTGVVTAPWACVTAKAGMGRPGRNHRWAETPREGPGPD